MFFENKRRKAAERACIREVIVDTRNMSPKEKSEQAKKEARAGKKQDALVRRQQKRNPLPHQARKS